MTADYESEVSSGAPQSVTAPLPRPRLRSHDDLRTLPYEEAAARLSPTNGVNSAAETGPLAEYPAYNQAHHNQHDAMIRRVVTAFNTLKRWDPSHPHYLDPNLVKAWALQESGGHATIFSTGDMMQMNNPGDWAEDKSHYLGLNRRTRLKPEQSLTHALHWAYYKGEVTKALGPNGELAGPGWYRTRRGSRGVSIPGYQSKFVGWETALTKYNGGGVADYHGDITEIYESGDVPTQ